MSVTRIAETLQPTWARTASAIAYTSSAFGNKVQVFLEQTLAATRGFDKQLANVLVALLTPASVLALAFGLWRLGADLEWTGEFPISNGLFSHWQVWIALALSLKLTAPALRRNARAGAETSEEN